MAPLPPPVRSYLHPGDRPGAPPQTAAELVARLLAGDLFVYPATPASLDLVAAARAALSATLGAEFAPAAGPCPAVPFAQTAALRAALYRTPDLRARGARLLASLGLPRDARVDTPRLRVVTHGGEARAELRPVYVVHRDTWYGCPQGQVNAWVPVFDAPAPQGFAFYPRFFERAVPNGSGEFEYARWTAEVGWHGAAPLEDYPAPREEAAAFLPELRFDVEAGQVLLFASHHLHQTTPNPVAGTTRLSLDVRFVAGDGAAPNVDNASRGADQRLREEFAPVASLV